MSTRLSTATLFAIKLSCFIPFLWGSIDTATAASIRGVVLDDDGDIPVEGIQLIITDVNSLSSSNVETLANGTFTFSNLPAGNYSLSVSAREPFAPIFASAGAVGRAIQPDGVIEIVVSQEDAFDGYVFDIGLSGEFGKVGGSVYDDANNDGERALDEQGIANVLIEAISELGATQETVTDAIGMYEFILGSAEFWTIVESQPVGWDDGKEVASVRNGVVGEDRYTDILPNGGSTIAGYNFGELKLVAEPEDRVSPRKPIIRTRQNAKFNGNRVVLRGFAVDDRAIAAVKIRVVNRLRKQYLQADGSFGSSSYFFEQSVSKAGAKRSRWVWRAPMLQKGRYRVDVRAIDVANNESRKARSRKFSVR